MVRMDFKLLLPVIKTISSKKRYYLYLNIRLAFSCEFIFEWYSGFAINLDYNIMLTFLVTGLCS